ncbi:hypothetical protein EPUS_05233 [Endocarpon pusillum Z07020]|uniref:Uncharacterized protein n=1 Tax=Endocarpon pusillum (strain Z07020 / HMAS-L-300199) TaxID=1263415 RepID=U1HN05_ENDPU|nr:uncharacterized protein EPUS_05233 [Endocarpon pusillum Z07020]ERF70414.1 hypothetical protein EPUS_05233 [Endocarpon pusillum Z07020]
MSYSQSALEAPMLGTSETSTPSAAAAAAATTTSRPSSTASMGNSNRTSTPSTTNGLPAPQSQRQSKHTGLPIGSSSTHEHHPSHLMANGADIAATTTASSTTTANMGQFEIIDLCSDSDGEDAKVPPKKKAKLDDGIAAPQRDYGMEKSWIGGISNRTGTGTGEEVVCGVTWKRSVDMAEGEEDAKDERPDHAPSTAPGEMPPENRKGHLIHNNNPTGPAAAATSNNEIIIEIKHPNPFAVATQRVPKSSDTINPVVTRTETVQTQTGMKKRKMVGPFVLEDADDGDGDGDATMRSPGDEGYGSFCSGAVKPDSHDGGNILSSGSGSSHSPPDAMDGFARQSKVGGGMELFQRRRQLEDKCAETSRRMREEALKKRNAEMQEAQKSGLSQGFLEDSLNVRPNAESYQSDIQIGKETNSTSQGTCSAHERQSNQDEFDDDDDDFFADDTFSSENIEAQLDLAQAFANNNGNLPSPKDLTRSYRPSTLVSSTEKADRAAEADSSPSNARDPPLQDSTQHPERQLFNGGAGKTATSGIEHYSQEQAEKYWGRVNKEERRKEKEKWPEKMEMGRGHEEVVASPCTATKVIGGAPGKDEARLLAAKESLTTTKQPLRAAPNVSGVLAQLAKNTRGTNETVGELADPGEFHQGRGNARHPSPTAHARQRNHLTIDEEVWTKDGTLRERKRDIENLMSSFTEIARCWCLVFYTLSPHFQESMKSQVHELKRYAGPILRGYTFRKNSGRRITEIRKNVERRMGKEREAGRLIGNVTQREIDSKLVELMGREHFHHGQSLLNKVREEWEDHKVNRKHTGHRKRPNSQSNSNASARSKPMVVSNMPYTGMDASRTGSEESDPYEGFNLNPKKRIAWQREDERHKRMEEALARYEKVAEPDGRTENSKRVRFAEQSVWDNEYDHTQSSESEESDEDEDGTAPSFGRGEDRRPEIEPRVGNAEPVRRNTGAKGLFSQPQSVDEKVTRSSQHTPSRATARKSLPAQSGNMKFTGEQQSPEPATKREVGGKSVASFNQWGPQETMLTNVNCSDIEESPQDADEVQSETEGSYTDDGDMADLHNDVYGTQYDIVADYEDFDGYEDAHSVPLGKHIDPRAAHRQMTRVMLNTVEDALHRVRGTGRIIWDIENSEVMVHSIILPTGGECRIRKVKSWVSAANWPGKYRARAVPVPQVYYIVHETKKTSLRPPPPNGEEIQDEELFGPEDFEDPQALVEKEQPMGFTNRESANSSALERLIVFDKRHNGAEGAEDAKDILETENTTDMAEYMEQIEHDKLCFERERRVWIETEDGRKGKEEIKVWVEEMFVDMHHV